MSNARSSMGPGVLGSGVGCLLNVDMNDPDCVLVTPCRVLAGKGVASLPQKYQETQNAGARQV